ncbi:MAG: hypothetical protein QOE90_2753 [Thermoplasmata archaeon]|nr:hypothetical protein [Thermoplasmata archaeon]
MPTADAHAPSPEDVRDAAQRLLARRHAQRARPTFGDEADAALLAALRARPDEAQAREAGLRVGREVYARRCYEDNVPGAVAILSTTLLASGLGSVSVESWFHRQGVLAFRPLDERDAAAASSYVSGLLAGYLGEALNCRAEAQAQPGARFAVRLLEGRDVNHGRAAA